MNWFHLLTIIFVIAKLTGYVSWSWWLVFLPSILTVGLGLVVLCAVLALGVIAAVLD
jgi:hypothetical protein